MADTKIIVQGQGQPLQGKSHTEHISNVTKQSTPPTKLDQWKAEVQKNNSKQGK